MQANAWVVIALTLPYHVVNGWSIGGSFPNYRNVPSKVLTSYTTLKGQSNSEPLESQADGEEEAEDDNYFDRLVASRKSRSLSELEDEAERRLDLRTQLSSTTSKQLKNEGKVVTDSENPSFLLQHSFRAPYQSFSSSNTFERNEQQSSFEDQDAFERQEKIKSIIALEDAKYKEERKRKKMGAYADATNMEEFKQKEEQERRRIQQGMHCVSRRFHVHTLVSI